MINRLFFCRQKYLPISVCHVRKDEKRYYEDLVDYSKKNLMLFPYHLSDVVVKSVTMTPFQYYVQMLELLMSQEKSYDSLPNFAAADCKESSILYRLISIPIRIVMMIRAYFRPESRLAAAGHREEPVH